MPIDFRIRDYASPRLLFSLHRTMSRLERADPAELRRYQASRLRAVLSHAQAACPHWRDTFKERGFDPRDLQDPAQLQQLPVLTKDRLRREGDNLRDRSARRISWSATSGTSGEPLRVALDHRARALEFSFYRRAWSWGGYRLGAPFAELGTYHFLRSGRDPSRLLHWQPTLRRLMINSSRVSPAELPEVLRALQRHRPRFLKGLPSALQHLVRCAELSETSVPPMRAVFSAGEVVTARARSQIQGAFRCRLFDAYGHMERTMAASQCEEGRYHIHGAYGVLEVEGVERAEDGVESGRALGTGIHNLAQPLVRYDTGDRVILDPDPAPCGCGRTLPTLRAIEGRVVDVITTPDGRALSGLPMVFDAIAGVDVLQLVQAAGDVVVARVVPGRGWTDATEAALARAAGPAIGAGMRFEVRRVSAEDLARTETGKIRPVVT